MTLDPRRVLVFRDVARAGSISAAARALGLTQPALSQHLNRLERDVGGPLLVRGAGGVSLTDAGATLLARADAVAAELHAAGEELAALAQLRAGRVRLAAFPSAAATLVPSAVQALAASSPGVRVGFVEAEPPEAVRAVLANEVDLAVVFGHGGPPQGLETLVWHPLLTEPVHLVVPVDHPLAGRADAELATLAGQTWVGGCVRCREHLVERCRAAGFEPDVRHESDDYVVVQNLVARGLGITLLPASALTVYRHPGVAVLASRAFGERHVGLVHRRGAQGVPATAALVAQLGRAARS